jgi:moderate conductance mechanosensitive channel
VSRIFLSVIVSIIEGETMRHAPIRSGLIVVAMLTLALFFVQPCPAGASQGTSAEPPGLSHAGIEKLLADLEDPQKLEEFKGNLRTLLALQDDAALKEKEAEPTGLVGHLLYIVSGSMQEANQVLSEAARNLLKIPALAVDLAEQAKDPEVLRTWGEMAGKVLLVLLAGFLAQMLAFRLLSRARKSLDDQEAYNKGIRALLMVGKTFLELIPIAAFAVAAYGLLPLLDPRPGTQLVALTLINANVLVRLILAFTRLILMPGAPSLRFLPMDDETVQYFYLWVRRVSRLGVYGYFILEAALLLGLSESLHILLLKLLGLIITLMAIILIMQNRADVTSWLRGNQTQPENQTSESESDGFLSGKIQTVSALRRRVADFWHVGAIVLIMGMFMTWALEIPGGFLYLARAIIMTVMVIAVMSLFIRLSRKGLDYLFKISDELKTEHPELEARANRYLPLLKHGIRGVIYAIAVFSILQAWGLGTLSWLFSPQGGAIVSDLLIIFLIIAGTFLVWEIVSVKIENYLARGRQQVADKKGSTRLLTLLPLVSNVIRIALILVAGMSVLAHIGINIAPLLAGAGVIGLAIGFGAQSLVRDVITGAFILIEDSIAVGDFVEAGGHSGSVEHLTVRTVTLRDLNGTVHVVPFGEVTTVLNYNRDYGYALIDAGVAYRENYGEVVQLLQDVATELQQDETWGSDIIGDLEVFGLNKLADSAVEIRVRLKTQPMRQFSVRRAFLERMKRVFDENGIEIPFPHQTIWFGEDKNGSAPPMRLFKEPGESMKSREAIDAEPEKEYEEPEIKYFSESEATEEVVREVEKAEEEQEEEERTLELQKQKKGENKGRS